MRFQVSGETPVITSSAARERIALPTIAPTRRASWSVGVDRRRLRVGPPEHQCRRVEVRLRERADSLRRRHAGQLERRGGPRERVRQVARVLEQCRDVEAVAAGHDSGPRASTSTLA